MFAIAIFFWAICLTQDGEVSAETPAIHEAVQRSVPYIEERGDWWIQKKKCMSCHRVSTMVWSLHEAKRKGFNVSSRLDEWTNWTITESLSENDKGKVKARSNREGVAQLLVALRRFGMEPANRQQLTKLIIDEREENGTWKPCGQLPSQKRPKPETTAVSAMWIIMAAASETPVKVQDDTFAAARKYINESSSTKSTEWYASRLMLATQEDDEGIQREMIGKLTEQQREDGGWGWLTEDPSDALGTGIALYAFREAGVATDSESIRRATQFLLNTQKEDGSWDVHGTKANRKEKVQETATYWGTTWAVIGLLSAIPETDHQG